MGKAKSGPRNESGLALAHALTSTRGSLPGLFVSNPEVLVHRKGNN